MPIAKKFFVAATAIVAVLLAVADSVSRADYVAGLLPEPWRRHLPTAYLAAFAVALILMRVRQDDEPDVLIQFTEPNRFTFSNVGSYAVEVEVEPLSTGEIRESVTRHGEATTMVTPALTATFPKFDIGPNAREIAPSVWWDAFNTRRDVENSRHAANFKFPTIADFFEELMKRRYTSGMRDITPPDDNSAPEDHARFRDVVTRLQREPITVEITVRFKNRDKTRRWKRVETLAFDPSTSLYNVTHGPRTELRRIDA